MLKVQVHRRKETEVLRGPIFHPKQDHKQVNNNSDIPT